MNPPRLFRTIRAGAAAAGLLAAQAAMAQAASSAPADPSPTEESVVLSPFVVSGERDTGYVATDSLAGTRLRTPLRDIASSISVVTKDLIEDLGVKNMGELLVFTTGTEVYGIGGNFSNSTVGSFAQEFESLRRNDNPSTRVRGLAGADQTRNYFGTRIPFDAYNTQSVTINRGANAILFGLGSPAGIIENSLVLPAFRNTGRVEVRGGSYGSNRQSLDVERVLLPEKLSLRIAALNDAQEFEQEFAFRDQQRMYGAVEFRPFRSTTLRVNVEKGKITQRLPRTDPPLDSLSTWWQFGKQARADSLFPAPVEAYQRANNLDGAPGNWFWQPSLIYYTPTTATHTDAFMTFADAPGVRYRWLGPRNSKEVAQFITFDPLAPFLVGKQVIDRSIFDYRKQMIDGPNSKLWKDFDAVNFAAEQLLLDGNAGIELVYDRQKAERYMYDTIYTYRGNNLLIDVNRQTIDGRVNPNFGRPYVSGGGGWSDHIRNDDESIRGTAFLRHDFEEKTGGWFGRLLGVQTLTGFSTKTTNKQYLNSGPVAALAPTYRNGRNGNGLADDRNLGSVVYLGPSLAGASSPTGANISGVKAELVIPDQTLVWTENVNTNYQWVQQTHSIYKFPNFEYLARNTERDWSEVKSYGAVLQGNWAKNLLVSTIGWRSDEVKNARGVHAVFDPVTGARPLNLPALTPGVTYESSLWSYGFAFHVPEKWTRRLPAAPRLSLYYNDSENFQVTDIRRTVFGDSIENPSGDSKEIGFGLSLLDDKFNLRATWYETRQQNITDARLAGVLVRTADLESRIMSSNTPAALAALGYVGIQSAQASELFKSYMKQYQFTVTGTNPDGTLASTYSAPSGVAEITSSVSKGMEIELTYNPLKNWRIMFNVSQEKAQRGDAGQILKPLLDERLAQWTKPAIRDLVAGNNFDVKGYVSSNITNVYENALRSVGQPVPELREWRANLITNYEFRKDSFLKGWSIGGAARWQDDVVIGFPAVMDATLGRLVEDIQHPFMGAGGTTYDGWLAYTRPIYHDRVTWKIQLNVKNVFNDGLLVPVKANPVAAGDLVNYEVAAWRIGEARRWELTSTFSF